MITEAGREKKGGMYCFFSGPRSLVWSNTHPRHTATMRLLSLTDKPGTAGMNKGEERCERSEVKEMNDERERKEG